MPLEVMWDSFGFYPERWHRSYPGWELPQALHCILEFVQYSEDAHGLQGWSQQTCSFGTYFQPGYTGQQGGLGFADDVWKEQPWCDSPQ